METKQTPQQFSNTREQRAKQILAKGNPEMLEDNSYLVPSQFSDKKYLVTFQDTYSCNCLDFVKRCRGKGLYCKHIKTILFIIVILFLIKLFVSEFTHVTRIATSSTILIFTCRIKPTFFTFISYSYKIIFFSHFL